MKKEIIWGFIIVILLILIVLVFWRGTEDNNIVKVGVIAPLSGEVAAWGDLYKAGIEYAYKDLLQDGMKDGKKFELFFEDGMCNGTDAVSAAQKLVNIDKVDFIIGGLCSGETLAIIDIVNENNIPVLTSGSNPEIAPKSSHVFQTWPSDSFGGKTLANIVKDAQFKKVAVLSANTDYAVGISDVFVKNFGEVSIYEKFNDKQTDFRDVVVKVTQSGPDALVINTQNPRDLIILSKQLREGGVSAPIFTAYHNSPEISSSPQLEGMIVVNAPIIQNDKANVVKKYKEEKGVEPVIPFVIGEGYDSFNLVVDAFTETNGEYKNVVSYLNDVNFEGLIGKFYFENRQISGLELPVKKLVGGNLVDLK